uniref:BCL3 transcription coactivator n=1 Tax=Neogobius melanostomus TaxID=47308 RepID=A0A8C6TKY8_9GOBI
MPMVMTMNGEQHSLAAAPLDLRTTPRARGNSGPTSPDSRVTSGAPTFPACTETDSLDKHVSKVKEESNEVCKQAASAPLTLPFRKRKIPVEFDSPENGDGSLRAAQGHEWTAGAGHSGSIVRLWPPFPNYGSFFCVSPVSVPEPINPVPHHTDHLLSTIALATRQDEDGDTPLHIAVVQGEIAIVYRLLQILLGRRSPDIFNNLRQTPLHLAVITQQAKLVEALLRAGADPKSLDRNGQTSLHLCCEYDQGDCLPVLLSHHSAPTCLETRNYEGLSPLHLAVLRSHKDLAAKLLTAGADINAMDIKSGLTPLMHAVESNNVNMVHFLIENGCDVNSQSYSGNTALHCACGRGQVDTVRLLLKNGADSGLKNYHNDTPVMVTTNKKITDALRGRSSKPIRVQDEIYVTTSPTQRSSSSPSPNQSRGCSPSSVLPMPHQRHSQSPKPPAVALYSVPLLSTSALSPTNIYPTARMDNNT